MIHLLLFYSYYVPVLIIHYSSCMEVDTSEHTSRKVVTECAQPESSREEENNLMIIITNIVLFLARIY